MDSVAGIGMMILGTKEFAIMLLLLGNTKLDFPTFVQVVHMELLKYEFYFGWNCLKMNFTLEISGLSSILYQGCVKDMK